MKMNRSGAVANPEVPAAKVDVVALFKDTSAAWGEDKASRLGAAVAYYTIFSMAPLLIVVSIWLYTLVFAFSALWFAHYLLAALRDLRGVEDAALAVAPVPAEPARLLPPPARNGTHDGIAA